jgi:hypothetical protein
VHRVVLASRSPYWRAQLTNWDMEETVLNVKIVSSDILKIVIEFIYTLDVQKQITSSNVVDLLQAANIYDLKLLREECVHFLRQRISLANILEVLSFSHIDSQLEGHATDFLARNFSKFCVPGERRAELLDLPADKMVLVLRSKLLILRDSSMFPLRAVAREAAILAFVLEYIQHRGSARAAQAADLVSAIRLHLLPLAKETLPFPEDRWLPVSLLQLGAKLGHAALAARLQQMESDVKYLHTTADPAQLYRDTFSEAAQSGPAPPTLGQRNPAWDTAANREASVAHEWWTAHDHDSRFVPSSTARGTRIVGVSGSSGREKHIRRLTFCIGEVHDNHDLLPEWFHLAPQYSMQNLQQELGEYIGAMQVRGLWWQLNTLLVLQVVWSTGKENWVGCPQGLNQGRVTVQLEEGEHIVQSYQLFWGPRQVFVPLEVVDFVFITSKGRKFGPFTKQVRKLYSEAEGQKKEWSFTDIRHKLNSKRIGRRVDSPQTPMCRPASIGELTSLQEAPEDDSNWAAWLDGFLCVLRNDKITRLTLKFAVYLDCRYQERRKPSAPGPGTEGGTSVPVLLSYRLQDLQENMAGPPVRIHDYQFLYDNMMSPYAEPEAEESRCKRLRRMLDWNETGLHMDGDPAVEEGPEAVAGAQPNVALNPMAEAQQVAFADEALNHIIPVFEPELLNPVVVNQVVNNNGELEAGGDIEENNNGGEVEEGEEGEGDHLHGDVWDALINDDLRAIGHLYDRRTLKIDDYLE